MPADLIDAMKDSPIFQAVSPDINRIKLDTKLPDGTEMFQPGGLLVPQARQFAMIVNSGTRVYSYRFDEAMRDSVISARAMKRDAFLLGLIEERILPTINRPYELEVDNDRDPDQVAVRDGLSKIVKSLPNFDAYKRAQLEAVWFGRAGCQWGFKRDADNDFRWGIPGWDPIHGDSIQFTFDGTPAILLDAATVSWYVQHGATQGPHGDIRSTDRGGMALVLQRPYWRDRFAIHRHIMQKADYFEGELAGSVQGFGLRGMVYWQYVVRTDALTWMLAYMQAVGQMDLLVFNYPAGDAVAKANQEANAQKIIGKAAIACPRNPTGNWPAIEQIQMNSAGLKALHDLVADYFDRHIERLIVGQSMSSGADKGDGLGGTGRADFARATKDEILVYDTQRLDCTMTTDLIAPLKKYNYAKAKFPVRFKSVIPDLEADNKLERGLKLVSVNVPVDMDELRRAGGYSRPVKGAETIGNPMGALMGLPPGVPPELAMSMAPPAPPPGPPGAGGPPSGGPGSPPAGQPGPSQSGQPPVPFGPSATFSGGQTGLAQQGPMPFRKGNPTRYANPEDYPEHQQLLAAIHANPLEATSHLAHADWLEENGFPDEAAFRRKMAGWVGKQPSWEAEVFHAPNDVQAMKHFPWRFKGFSELPSKLIHEVNPGEGIYRDLALGIHLNFNPSHPSHREWKGEDSPLIWNTYAGMENALRRAFHTKREREKGTQPPTPSARYDGMAAAPAASANPGTSPNMGYPGGSNTYIPKFGNRKRHSEEEVGFTRYDRTELTTNITNAVDSLLGELNQKAPEPPPVPQPRKRKEEIRIHYGADGKPTGATKVVEE